ncbi:hypothetical protein [Laspinema palackyanum]|uniref:hypothetical protein n=1 Tax=Laspinema palackyanum TaxID=3231601 RepID=UPI00345C9EB9|nr:hypothetical protein [Laspinema sp. D2c]
MSRNEANTRKELIDKALQTAGWNLEDPNQVGIEIPVDGYDAEPWNGVTDYCLYQPNGEAIAVVEAKRQSRDPRVAEQQVRRYVTEIEKRQSCFSSKLRTATPEQLNRIIADLASQMKNRRSRPSSFVEIDFVCGLRLISFVD